ncbi:exosortase A system-associated hydrolase 2 [Duganella sp. CF517]|uniref:hydrolase 2, exosortase A system-associated n=1 Tax=Duganella sp. CF517 TaxID=1881038 RepID=UPI0008B93EFC|nr:hydrolase 2, exosortase A system-associated [Duganella sp. CF517]SEN85586.1 exosortase A system-associated hydrolase 2 [Duganella sp. CF517]
MNHVAPEAFFLPAHSAAGGQRYCLYQPAAGVCRGALLYVPPFAEEMNKSRRMAALLALELARQGIATVRIDLHGCGDSSGDFADARWESWRDDVGLASAWLERRSGHRPALLGLRLGALLAMDYAANAPEADAPRRLILWQPVLDGATFLTQFLRLRTAGAMMSAAGAADNSTAALRTMLAAGRPLEVAGYELSPQLTLAIDGLKLAPLGRAGCALHWFDVGQPGRALSPATAKALASLRERGVEVDMTAIDGPAFWGSQEIATCQPLLEASAALAPCFAMESADAL